MANIKTFPRCLNLFRGRVNPIAGKCKFKKKSILPRPEFVLCPEPAEDFEGPPENKCCRITCLLK